MIFISPLVISLMVKMFCLRCTRVTYLIMDKRWPANSFIGATKDQLIWPTTPFVGEDDSGGSNTFRECRTVTNRSICMLGRLVLAASCTVGVGAFSASPILFRDNFNSGASAANWEPVIGTWTFQRGKLIGTPEEEGPPDAWIYVASEQFSGNIEVKVIYDQAAFSAAETR